MPFIHVKTNCKLNDAQAIAIKTKLGQAITAIPGKTESWLMVELTDSSRLYFQGTDAPAAIAEVSLLGDASSNALTNLTSHITGILCDEAGISSDRVYVKYYMTDVWGWNGMNL